MSVASDSPKAESDETNGKRYICSYMGCNQKFDSDAALAVHRQKHQMTLTLGPSKLTSLADVLPVDQTPTPTRFLHLGNQMGLFDELNLNPFDREFKTAQKDGLTSKQRRAAVVAQQLQALNNKRSPSTPTRSIPGSSVVEGIPVPAPVQVIALTPTLPSPVTALPGAPSPFLVPPLLPSPQGLHIPSLSGYTATSPMQVPANLLSPTLMPFPSSLIPGVQAASLMADAQQRAAAFTQAMFAAAASAASTTQVSDAVTSAQPISNHVITSSAVLNANMAEPAIHSNENLKIPSIVLPKQERPMSVSSSTSDNNSFPEMPNSLEAHQQNMQQTEQYRHGNADNLTQYQVAMHPQVQTTSDATISSSTFAAKTQQVQTGSNQHQIVATAMSHPTLSHRLSSEFGSNPNLLDAKQKLKESLTSNKSNLQQSLDHPLHQNTVIPVAPTSSAAETANIEQKPPGRRRGRQSQDIDPDVKRQRFLERNRAAASRCRNKKKLWVNGLESKAKNLSQTNVLLQNEIAALKDEIATLKQLLLSHRDCPIMKMQQQSMSLAGINLDLTSSVTLSSAVKSETSSNPDSLHPPLASTLSNNSIAERNVQSQQSVATSGLSNGSMFSTLSSTAASS